MLRPIDSIAIGTGATVSSSAPHSTAIGAGATVDPGRNNEMVFGTKDDTYTTPGITSGFSKSRQSGPLEVVTSDRDGHLATDGGSIFKALDEAESVSLSPYRWKIRISSRAKSLASPSTPASTKAHRPYRSLPKASWATMSSVPVIEWPSRAASAWELITAGATTSSAAASVGRSPGGDSGLTLSCAAPALPGRRCRFLHSSGLAA